MLEYIEFVTLVESWFLFTHNYYSQEIQITVDSLVEHRLKTDY